MTIGVLDGRQKQILGKGSTRKEERCLNSKIQQKEAGQSNQDKDELNSKKGLKLKVTNTRTD